MTITFLAQACNQAPRWKVVDKGTLELAPGQAYIDEIHPYEERPIRIRLLVENDIPVQVYWVSTEDHERLQSGIMTEEMERRIEQNTFVRGSGKEVSGETILNPGSQYLYFQQDWDYPELVDLKLEYEIEFFR